MKARVIKQAKRMKGSVVYKKDDRFEEAKMKAGEEVGLYAQAGSAGQKEVWRGRN